MSRCMWIRGLYLWVLPALVLAGGAPSFGDTNQALNKPAVASSVYKVRSSAGDGGTDVAAFAVDGNVATRWSSLFTDNQWIYVDLQATYLIQRVKLTWDSTYGRAYHIQVSGDATHWTTIQAVTNGDGGTDDLSFAPASGRYVRMYGITRSSMHGYILKEFEVYGSLLAVDTTAPVAVSDLATGTPTATGITLTWTAPGDDGASGTASGYDIRYAASAITEANWASATPVTGEPAPAPAGTGQSMVVFGLLPGTTYYFALKTSDDSVNTSAISNSPSGTTPAAGASTIVALKRNPGLVTSGPMDARFKTATVVTTTVQDVNMWGTQNSRWYNGGATVKSGGYDGNNRLLHKYDLSSIPPYARINLAQLRLYASGAATCVLSTILTHDWIEGSQVNNYPGAAGGVTNWAPIGYNTSFNQNPSGGGAQPWGAWGPNSDSRFDLLVDAGPGVNPSSGSQGYIAYNVTADVQAWVQGSAPNFGWVQKDTRVIYLSEAGSDQQPVLFVDYVLEGDTTPPATVADLATRNLTSHSVTLTWTAPGDDGAAGTAARYEVRCAKSPITAASWVLATALTEVPAPQAAGTVQSMEVSGLLSNTTYYFAIKAADEVPNVTPLSNVVSIQTAADNVPPAAVGNLAAGNPSNHSLTLSWTAPGNDNNSGIAASYDIRYSTSPITDANWASAATLTGQPVPALAGTSQSLMIDSLAQNTTYYFAMKTSDEVPNTSVLSNVVSGQTLADTTAPGAVTNLVIAKAKSSALWLTWIASGDDAEERIATSYDIRYRTGGAVTEGNWASCTPVTGEPAPVQFSYHGNMWIGGLSPSTTYYVGIKAIDEVGNASEITTVSAATSAASLLTRPLLQADDLEYLGAFKLPTFACGYTTAYTRAGIAIRQVDGQLRFLACTHTGHDGLFECNFPGWGANQSTWPQATITQEWNTTIYGNPSCLSVNDRVAGLNYDPATGRLYYSYGDVYNVSLPPNDPTIGCAVLDEAGPIVYGPWYGMNFGAQIMRTGSLSIPDWFADAYLGGRTLGVGFGGHFSGWAGCSPGPTLAAAHHPDDAEAYLDTVPLLRYYQDDLSKWCTRDNNYWTDGVYNFHDPVGDVGRWMADVPTAGIWIDLPDKQGLLYMCTFSTGRYVYDYGSPVGEGYEVQWYVYDPADLAEVAQGHMNSWEPAHHEWYMPNVTGLNFRKTSGCAFDAASRTLYVMTYESYTLGGQAAYPLVHGYRIKESPLPPKPGDINHDGYVNVGDLQALVAAWGSQAMPPSANWNADADINTDTFVNVGDLQLLVAHWGE